MGCVVYLKPDTMYDADTKQYRPFGSGEGATLFPMWLCAMVVAIVSYVLTDIIMTWTHSNNTIQPMDEQTEMPESEEPMRLTPMRRATFGGQQMPSFEAQHNAYAPHQHTTHQHHMNQPRSYANQSPHSSFAHSPQCAMHNASAYMHPSKQKMHVQNSRVWKNVM